MPRFAAILIALLVVLLGGGAAILLLQRSILFPAPRLPGTQQPHDGEPIALSSGAARFLAPLMPVSRPVPLLIFTHGNAELVEQWVDQFDEPRRQGWAVLLVEYPGYGRAPGSPSERSIVATVLAAYDWAAHDPRIDTRRIVALGRSLGGAPAAQLATQRNVAALVLESSFTSVRVLAARMFVPGFLVRDPFDNLAALAHYRGPLLVLHGTLDQTIPVSHGRALAAAVAGADFVQLECGHNDCPRLWREKLAWLKAHGVSAP